MEMLGITLQEPVPAQAPVTFWLSAPQETAVIIPEHPVAIPVLIRGKQVQIAIGIHVEPAGADGAPRLGDADFEGDVREFAVVVPQEPVDARTLGDIKIEVAVGVVVDERHLPGNAPQCDARRLALLDENGAAVAGLVDVEAIRRAVVAGVTDVEVDIAVAVDIAPRCRSRVAAIGRQPRARRDVLEAVRAVAIKAYRGLVEGYDEVEVAVVIEVAPRVGLAARVREEFRLHRRESEFVRGGNRRDRREQGNWHAHGAGHFLIPVPGFSRRAEPGCRIR